MNLGCRSACTKISDCNLTRGEAISRLRLRHQRDLPGLRPVRFGDLGHDLDLGFADGLSPTDFRCTRKISRQPQLVYRTKVWPKTLQQLSHGNISRLDLDHACLFCSRVFGPSLRRLPVQNLGVRRKAAL